jgi:uncharacterized membrane protein
MVWAPLSFGVQETFAEAMPQSVQVFTGSSQHRRQSDSWSSSPWLWLPSREAPTATELAWSSLAGLCSGLGLVFYYRALSGGSMGSSAPVTGVVTAAVPALTGFLFEGAPSPLQMVGFALAIIAIAQVTGLSRKNLTPNKQLIRSLLAGIFFGLFLIFLGQVSQDSYLYPLSITRVVTIAMALAMAYVSGGPKIPQTAAPLAVGAGVFDSMGSLLYLLARHAGRLDVAGVLSSLYPVSTVVLAKTILQEPHKPEKGCGHSFCNSSRGSPIRWIAS